MFTERSAITAQWVAVMEHRRAQRGIKLASHVTRCLQKGEIHEFIVCAPHARDQVIDDVAYLGFAVIDSPGVVTVGDTLDLNVPGDFKVLGFDYTHMPNHINVLISTTSKISTGHELGLTLNQPITIKGD